MISLTEAQARLLALAAPLAEEAVPLSDAVGRWAAQDVKALRTQPARDLSAMDGYAVRYADLPASLSLIGESSAGHAFMTPLGEGQAVRIFTGAVVPHGADTVLVQENAECTDGHVRMTGDGPKFRGAHIRKSGSDFEAGQCILKACDRINAAQVGLAAMGGWATLPVRRKPVVALVSTGDELVPPGTPTRDDQIPASNAVMMAAQLSDLPAKIITTKIIQDDINALIGIFNALSEVDIVVTLGGASVGDHDLVLPALTKAGAQMDFWKVAMRPGKPVMAGVLGNSVVLGLPGNPVSAFVTATLFLRPLIAHLSGANQAFPTPESAELATSLPENGPRIDHLRGILSGGLVALAGDNDSAQLLALSKANVLIIRPPNAPPAEIGESVQILRINSTA